MKEIFSLINLVKPLKKNILIFKEAIIFKSLPLLGGDTASAERELGSIGNFIFSQRQVEALFCRKPH
jgi:hypothetical protein